MNLRFYQNIETGEIVFLHNIEKGFCYSIGEKTKQFKFDNLGYESKEQFFRRHKRVDMQSDYYLAFDDDGNYYIGKKKIGWWNVLHKRQRRYCQSVRRR